MTVTQQTYNSNSNYGERRARWTVEFNFSDITVSGSSFVFNTPTINAKFQPLTIQGQSGVNKPRYGYAMFATPNTTWPARYYDPGDGPISRTSASIGGTPISSGTDYDGWLWNRPTPSDEYYRYELWFPSESNITPTYKTLNKKNYVYTGSGEQKTNTHTITLNTSDFFTPDNKSLRSLNVVFNFANIFLAATDIYPGESATGGYITDAIIDDNYSADYIHGYSHEDEGWLPPLSYDIGTVTLDVPPSIIPGTPSSGPFYESVSTYTVPINAAEAYYGGDISKITLTIGANSTTKTYSTTEIVSGDNETISVISPTAGTYTPILTIEDSRGQTKSINLSSIIVNPYVRPSVNFDVYRTNNIGKKDDEGEYGLIKATITYTSAIANLTAPTVTILDPDNNPISKTITWYSIYSESSGISTSSIISNWSTVSSGQEIYGLISANFNNNKSYQVTLVETDTAQGSSTPITQILSTAYYTIDFKAGGKEIAFGSPANDDLTDIAGKDYSDEGLFKCKMGTSFNDMTTGPNGEVKEFISELGISGAGIELTQSDWIVEQGTSGIWTYRKWSSGISECWGKWTGTLSHNATALGGYQYVTDALPYPANLFVEEPKADVSGRIGSGHCLTGTLYGATNSSIKAWAVTQVSGSQSCVLFIRSIGRWK